MNISKGETNFVEGRKNFKSEKFIFNCNLDHIYKMLVKKSHFQLLGNHIQYP